MLPSQLIAEEKNWLQGCLARTEDGYPVSPVHPAAVKFCAVGALVRFCELPFSPVWNQIMRWANEEAAKRGGSGCSIVSYNNAVERKHHEVVSLVQDVEARARKEGLIVEDKLCVPVS